MLSKPDYDRQEALAAHKSLLLLKIERLAPADRTGGQYDERRKYHEFSGI